MNTGMELSIGTQNLLSSPDPEIRAYLQKRERHCGLPNWRKLEGLRLGHAIQKDTNFKDITLMHRKREGFDKNQLLRDADPGKQDKLEVLIRCARCRHPDTVRVDPAPCTTERQDFMFGVD
ncbi:hypothetical protein TWF481_002552 [Arthrobotrys musiformis]